jgi:hypothetical protein
VRDSGHFCPYPRTYRVGTDHFPKATSGRWKSCQATEDVWFGEVLEVPLVGPAEARVEAAHETPSPRDSGPKSSPMHEHSLRSSEATSGDAIARDFVRLFRCSIPG